MNLKTLLQHYCIYGIVHYLLNIYSSFDCYFWNWIWYVSGPILPGLCSLFCTANVNWPITSCGCNCSVRFLLSRCLQWKITKSRKSNLFWANISTSRHIIYIRAVSSQLVLDLMNKLVELFISGGLSCPYIGIKTICVQIQILLGNDICKTCQKQFMHRTLNFPPNQEGNKNKGHSDLKA